MPITLAEFGIGLAILVGLPVAIIMMNRWRPRAGWWLLGAAVAFIVIGNAVEEATTGSSALF